MSVVAAALRAPDIVPRLTAARWTALCKRGQVEVISGVDGRVLYRVRHGQHFGETAITGRRRSATHRAASTCEMFVLSSDDLEELFNRRPREGRFVPRPSPTSTPRAYHYAHRLLGHGETSREPTRLC